MQLADIETDRTPAEYITPALVDRVAMISVHTSPVAILGGRDSGGMNVYISELSSRLIDRGINVDIFTRRTDPTLDTIIDLGEGLRLINVEAGPPAPVPKDNLFCYLPDFASEMAFLALREGIRYDIIHSHYWLSGWAAHLLKDHWRVPMVQMYHTMAHLKNAVATSEHRETTLRLQVERRLTALSDALIAANPNERMEMIQRLGAPDECIHTVPPGVDLELFQPGDQQEARDKLGLPEGPLILFVGRIDPVKGIENLFQGFTRLLHSYTWDGKVPKLVFIGGTIEENDGRQVYDEDLTRLREHARELNIDDQILFRGSQPRELLPDYYRAVDVCAVPSRYESFGLVAVEAMACGTPIVASRVGGLQYSIRHRDSGLLVEHSQPDELALALRQVLTDHELHTALSQKARSAAVRFSWESVSDSVVRVYERLTLGQAVDLCCPEEAFAS